MFTIIAGARPNFMKVAPLMRALRAANADCRLVHTGQHYDQKMSGAFFDELQIPEPDVNLGVGSGSHIAQIAEVMRKLEGELIDRRPQTLVVVGDVNSTLAAALTASKLGIPLAHVEAGLRSGDRTMPEETNRIVTDALSDWLFTSEPDAAKNLQREGIPAERIHFVGNVMIDTLLAHLEAARALDEPARFGLKRRQFAVLTLHRPSNVDDPVRLESILRAVQQVRREMPVVFPIHPRTQARLQAFGFDKIQELTGYTATEPLGYLSMLSLVEAAGVVMTDSGGLQEETTALRIPCLTLRENTERPITVEIGSNRLVGWKTKEIVDAFHDSVRGEGTGQIPEYWDGKAAIRIARLLVGV